MVNMICIGNTIFKTLSSVHGWINLWSRRRVIELVADDKLGMCGRCGRATHPQHSIDKSDLVRQLLDDWLIARVVTERVSVKVKPHLSRRARRKN